MQWDASPNAGFAPAGVRPWLPVADDYVTRNVAVQDQDPASFLSFFRALTALRQSESALTVGDYRSVDAGAEEVFAYVRTHSLPPSPRHSRFLIVLNLGSEARRLDLSELAEQAEVVLSTRMTPARPMALAALDLLPNEGLALRLPDRED